MIAPPREAEFQGGFAKWAGKALVVKAGIVHVADESVAAFQPDPEPSEDVDFHAGCGLHDEHIVVAFTLQGGAATPHFDVQHRVHGFVRNESIADFSAVELEVETLAVAVFQRDVVAQAVVRPADEERFSKFKAEKTAPVEAVGVVVFGVVVRVAAPEAGKPPTALAEHGFFALAESRKGGKKEREGEQARFGAHDRVVDSLNC